MTRFETPAALRAWLEKHHASAKELVVRIWTVHARARGVTNTQAVERAKKAAAFWDEAGQFAQPTTGPSVAG